MNGVSFDFSGVSGQRIGNQYGLHAEPLAQALAILDLALKDIRTDPGERGYVRVPDRQEVALDIAEYVRSVEGKFDKVVVLGIGGSSLGPRAVLDALTIPGKPGKLWGNRKGLPLGFLDKR